MFLLVYGIKAGLINRKILHNARRQTYSTGNAAIRRGVFYIVIGLTGIVLTVLALMRTSF
jgi:hypothetical protein